MTPQDAVQFRPQSFDGAAAALIEKRRPKLDSNAIQLLKGVSKQQVLAFCVYSGALDSRGIPCRANLKPPVDWVKVHEGRHPNSGLIGIENRERHHSLLRLQVKAALDFCSHRFGFRNAGVPKIP